MTTVYILRHSQAFVSQQGNMNTKDSVQLINEKSPLSVYGEELAKKVSLNPEFNNIDIVYASNYVRAMATAKYFANNNNTKVNIDDRLGERVQGITSWDELPKDFEERQLTDKTFKVGFGENQIEVRKRMEEVLDEIIKDSKDKRIVIVSHATAISFLLMKWCTVEYQKPYLFNGKEFFDGKWDYCTSFKLSFDDNNNLIDIENIKC